MDSTYLEKRLAHPSSLKPEDVELLEDLLLDYPYAQTLRLLYLYGLSIFEPEKFQKELQKAALYIADRKTLFYFLDVQERFKNQESVSKPSATAQNESLKPEESQPEAEVDQDKTLTLIDSFLSQVPEEEKQGGAIELATDYTAYLLEEEVKTASPMEGQDLIDDFLSHPEEKSSLLPQADVKDQEKADEDSVEPINTELPEGEDEGFFTETLAKIYVRQGRYAKALEILKKLSLKYPNKNAYFADQIRFLEKLIINDKSK